MNNNPAMDQGFAVPGTPNGPKRRMTRPGMNLPTLAAIIGVSATVGAASGAGVATLVDDGAKTTVIEQPGTSTGTTPATATIVSSQGVANLYADVRPSVVKITAVAANGSGGTGSGLVIDTQGHIVTNYHVVQGSDKLDVKLSDGSSVAAAVVGTDPGDDLAVLKVDLPASQLTPVKLASSSNVRIGDAVVAIGNPLDLDASITEGIISGMGRVLSDGNGRPLRQLIQTDSAINPGNSGGGLFNLNGELVGITNALENPSGQNVFVGIGYAIPVSTLQQYLSEMLAGRTVTHARLGISLQDVTPAVAEHYGLSVQEGVLIGTIDPASGAAKADLRASTSTRAGDVIQSIDGHNVTSFDDLANYLDTKAGGDTVSLAILRDGNQMNVSVTLDTWTN